jgi:hypothetical protein|tara:strand:+ start:379 stop:684 length:306 start_codon:yes stop_codon:yes gene_type:complete
MKVDLQKYKKALGTVDYFVETHTQDIKARTRYLTARSLKHRKISMVEEFLDVEQSALGESSDQVKQVNGLVNELNELRIDPKTNEDRITSIHSEIMAIIDS